MTISADRLRVEPAFLDADVAAVDDRRDGRGVRRRPADPVLLERLDQRRLGEARRRLGEVLGRGHVLDRVRVAALGQRRQRPSPRPPRRRRRRGLRCRRGRNRRTAPSSPRRAARRRPSASSTVVVSSSLAAICDASARCQIRRYSRSSSGLSEPGQRIRVAPEAGRPDRLVGLLGALRLRLVDAALGHRVRRARSARR